MPLRVVTLRSKNIRSAYSLLIMSTSFMSSGTAGPPLYGMPIAEQFLAYNSEKTFQHDERLPSLPVPPLHQTLSKYLDSGMKYTHPVGLPYCCNIYLLAVSTHPPDGANYFLGPAGLCPPYLSRGYDLNTSSASPVPLSTSSAVNYITTTLIEHLTVTERRDRRPAGNERRWVSHIPATADQHAAE